MGLTIKTTPAAPAIMSTQQAAAYLGVSAQFLHTDRHISIQSQTDPTVPYLRLGSRMIRYKRSDLDAFFERSRVGG